MAEEKASHQGGKNHMNTVVVLLAVMICLAITGDAGYVVYTQSRPVPSASPLEPEERAQSGTLTDQEGKQAELDTIVREGMLTSTIDAAPMMRDGKSGVNLVIEDPSDNGNRFIMAIIRGDTGGEIYESGHLDPEQYTESTPLDVELLAGEYRYIVNSDAYRISDNAYIGRGETQITLYVQN